MTNTPETPTPPVAPRLPLRAALWGLFTDPAILYTLQMDSCWRALRLMITVAFLGGLLISGLRTPQLVRQTLDWSRWLEREMGTVTFADKKIQWERPVELPCVTRHQGVRFDFVPAGTPVPKARELGPEPTGFWITPESVTLWRLPIEVESSTVEKVMVVENGKFGGVMPLTEVLENLQPGTKVLESGHYEELTSAVMAGILPLYILAGGLAKVFYALLFTSVIAVIPVLLKNPNVVGGYRQSFAFYGFASIPPLCAATLYGALQLPFPDYADAFVLCFIIYLVFVVYGVRPPSREEE